MDVLAESAVVKGQRKAVTRFKQDGIYTKSGNSRREVATAERTTKDHSLQRPEQKGNSRSAGLGWRSC